MAHALDSHRRATQYAQTHYESRDGMPHGLANSIAQTADGYLWTGSEEGLARFDGAAFTTFDHRKTDGIPANMFTALAVDSAGQLWAGTREHGVLHLIDGEFHPVEWEPGLQEQRVLALAFDRGGDLWVGLHDRGLIHLHDGALVAAFTAKDGLPSDDVRAIFPARDGTLWIGTFHGLVALRNGRLERGPAQLERIAVHAFAQDARGDLWCATASGLAHLQGDRAELVAADRLPSSDVRRVLFDRDGNLWVGTSGGAARMTPDGKVDALARPAAMILALFEDSEGNVWIGSEKGLDRLRDGDVLPFGASEGGTDDIAFGIREDPTGAMWITSSNGLYRIGRGDPAATPIVSDRRTMYAIFPNARGDVWFGARDGGIGRWHDGQFAWLGKRPWERVRSLAETHDGLWIGTEHGLFRMRGDNLDDGHGKLWMTSNRGIWSVRREQLEAKASGRRTNVESVLYGEADGMRDRECNGAIDPAGWKTSDGRLWFPTGKGVVIIDPARLQPTQPPNALLESLRVDDVPRPLAGTVELPPGSTRLELGYTAPALRSPERLRFRYRLDGFDSAWIDARTQRVAQYTNLAPGRYRFVVEAGIDGKWGRAGTLAVALRPQFYQTRWFFVLAIASIALAIVAVPLLRVRQLRVRAAELHQRVQEAIGELKVLSGLLPICAWCKKVRDDGGYWSKIEAYLAARTDAQFTHGICPDCNEKLLAEEGHAHSDTLGKQGRGATNS
ncbi:MAG TPA: two-component regulator propeller domain-containing protein [Kofleriaceae bacterium]|nr:two-component regulator propeller domain-containing protein [Kofleriaceae bacterium]